LLYLRSRDRNLHSPARRTAPWMGAVGGLWLVGVEVMGSHAAAEATALAAVDAAEIALVA
jgi:hypothetical protein